MKLESSTKVEDYLNKATTILNRIENNIPLSDIEIAEYFGIEAKIVSTIMFMFRRFGRQAVMSITLNDEEIDEIIDLRYPNLDWKGKYGNASN